MVDVASLIAGFQSLLSLDVLIALVAGTVGGMVIGALPGFSAAMGVSLLIPITYGMSPVAALTMLVAMYTSAIYGGSITAILCHTPGTPASAATAIDGYQLTKQGRGMEAMGVATLGSAVGGTFSAIAMLLIAPALGAFSLKFSVLEYFLLAVFGPGLYVMAVSFAPEIIPIRLLTKLAQGEASTPLPPMLEMLCVTLLLEIVREAGLRAPQSISHTVSLVGALIIGETAVSAGIVSVPVLTMAAAATIATLAVPSLYEQSILFRFAVIVLAGCFGVPGLACAALTILAMACGSEPFGYDYLYPLMPPGRASVRDGFVRSIWSRLAKSGEVISRHEA